MLFALAGLVFAPFGFAQGGQTSVAPTDLPARGDDYLYAKALLRTGFPRLAIKLLEREETKPGQTPLHKREVGEQIVAAYQQLAGRSADAAERGRYLELARKKIETMAKELGASAVTP
ncbi:MAG TPA: hypothetical protein VMX57_03150, partial [Planctomycetota bacterium]|nr:hypothetical protein [Planctomycetota bacterium]